MNNKEIKEVINELFKSEIDNTYYSNTKRLKNYICEKFNRENVWYQELNAGGSVHPDFSHCEDIDTNHYVVSFFADIKGSTKMSAFLRPKKVLKIKKIILDVISEVIFAFDGYVARYQGDAVLAFFNNDKYKKSEAAWNAILAANEIIEIIEEYIAPRIDKELESADTKLDTGLRIGIDYGHEDSVVWAKVGSRHNQNSTEHTAMGFNVDVAAKIQGKVNKNAIGLGENIVNFLDIGEPEYLKNKNNMKFGNKNYKYWELNREKFNEDIKKQLRVT